MASNRNDKLISEAAELRADNASQRARIAELSEQLERTNAALAERTEQLTEAKAECARKEIWLNRYAAQLKGARGSKPISDRRAAMEAAKAAALAGRCTVRV